MPLMTEYTKDQIKESIINKLLRHYGVTLEEATPKQVYAAVASTVRDQIMLKWRFEKEARRDEKAKRLYYLSIEFLTGRWLHNNLLNLCSTKDYEEAFAELGLTLRGVLHEEPEPALGNGGLGRLAACFLDSLATLNLPAMGSTIRYEYGLFRQRIVDGQQVEVPDEWLTYGNAWEIPAYRDAVKVRFGGRVCENWMGGKHYVWLEDTDDIMAVPYDLPIVGYDSDVVDRLRTWSAVLPENFNLQKFSAGDYYGSVEDNDSIAAQISKVLYPEDNTYNGKKLRLMQEYFLVSATLQYAMKDYKRIHGSDMSKLPEKVAFQINDTHPATVIPELMRILVDEEHLPWEEAERITRNTVAYTNHTIMAEALEKWPEKMMRETLPRIYQIMEELNRRLCQKLFDRFPGEWDRIGHMAILAYDQVHTANMCIAYSKATNGVSQLHGDILKRSTFADYYKIMPEKFDAITNGITPRRWLGLCNPELTALLEESCGKNFMTRLDDLSKLKDAINSDLIARFNAIKQQKKEQLAAVIKAREGVEIPADAVFDVQVKRLHEYKRQLMNAFSVMDIYLAIKDGHLPDFPSTVFLFGAKAAPGYWRAKSIIRYINRVANLVNNDPAVQGKMKVLFLQNYNCSYAEHIIPAADISEQISPAGTEASGTGNMKFMLNGAVTLGTLDGANVEIAAAAGEENEYIFGATVEDITRIRDSYRARDIYEQDLRIRRIIDTLVDGTVETDDGLRELWSAILDGTGWHRADHYYVLYDLRSYIDRKLRAIYDWRDREAFGRKCLLNIAAVGKFSADRAILEYAEKIWEL
ncbi:MAG: glycogen/starch/alpha-glucan phosphorylase [Clostridia bacterium]|nr:glycogen/starch/alpha-glucan phosphorylase [Clostridia bacterium]